MQRWFTLALWLLGGAVAINLPMNLFKAVLILFLVESMAHTVKRVWVVQLVMMVATTGQKTCSVPLIAATSAGS